MFKINVSDKTLTCWVCSSCESQVGAVEVKQLFLEYPEISGVGQVQERDPATGLEETEAAPGLSVLGWVIWGSAAEMETEVWTCIWPESSVGKAGQRRGKLLMIVSRCLESSVV